MTFVAPEVEVAEPGAGVVDMGSVPLGGDGVSGTGVVAVTANAARGERAAPGNGLVEMAVNVGTLLDAAVPLESAGNAVAGHVAETVGMLVAPAGNECSVVRRRGRMAGIAGGIGAS